MNAKTKTFTPAVVSTKQKLSGVPCKFAFSEYGYDFVVHRPLTSNQLSKKSWAVSEVTSGGVAASGFRTQAEAIDEAKRRLAAVTPEKFKDIVDYAISRAADFEVVPYKEESK